MFEWKVEDMALLNEENNIFIGKEKIYKCEQELSREDKIAFVDSLQNGKLSYILSLIEKFDKEKDSLSKDKYGEIRTVSLKAWIRKNDTKSIIDNWYRYGDYEIVGVIGDVEKGYSKGFYNIYNDFVDEVFHCQLKKCREKEYQYFLEHDEYSILKKKFIELKEAYNTTFGVNIVISSNNDVLIYGDFADFDDDKCRDITIDELKYLIAKFRELNELVEKITNETNIKY